MLTMLSIVTFCHHTSYTFDQSKVGKGWSGEQAMLALRFGGGNWDPAQPRGNTIFIDNMYTAFTFFQALF